MAHTCECPVGQEITDISNTICTIQTGNFNKLAWQRLGTPFVDINDPAEWASKLIASNGTKIQISPLFASFDIPNSEPITFGGGDNSTPNAEELVTGENAVTVSGILQNQPQSVIDELIQLQCEQTLGVYMIDQFNNILFTGPTMTGSPVPIVKDTLFFSTIKLGGVAEPNSYTFRFSLAPHWSSGTLIEKSAVDLQRLLNT